MNRKQPQGWIHRFLTDENGSSAMEYALMAALIGIAIIGSVTLVSQSNQQNFNAVSDALSE